MSKYDINQLRGAWGAGKRAAEAENDSSPLKGKFFHSLKDGKIHWQGQVVGELPQEKFLVQLFSWLDGRDTEQKIVGFKEMLDWKFYQSDQEWRDAGDKFVREQANS